MNRTMDDTMPDRDPSGAAPALRAAAVSLRDALLAEAVALEGGDAAALLALASEKRGRVAALERVSGTAASAEVSELLRECRDLNATNAAAVATRLAATRSALVRLARLAGTDDAWGYSADGLPTRPRRGRLLGSG